MLGAQQPWLGADAFRGFAPAVGGLGLLHGADALPQVILKDSLGITPALRAVRDGAVDGVADQLVTELLPEVLKRRLIRVGQSAQRSTRLAEQCVSGSGMLRPRVMIIITGRFIFIIIFGTVVDGRSFSLSSPSLSGLILISG